ncbi:MAG TPA: hypothetical protein VKE98_20325 [Gemmataceae bacterium]|nr:hypothetical protein [Gemmataceae bacterium]
MAFTFGLPWVQHWLQGGSRQRKRRPPPRRTPVRRTCRLQLEPLEDRLTPVSLNFFPIGPVAVNPQPLPPLPVPPSVAIELDSMPNLPARTAGTSMQQEHIVGFLSKQITFQPAASTTASDPWFLHVSYSLNVSETATVVLPTALNAGSLWASFVIFGTWRASLVPVATTGTTWLINNATINENGSIWGALNMPSATAAPTMDTFMWTTQISENGAERPLMLPNTIPTGPIQMPWNFQTNIQSSGMVMEFPPEPLMPAPLAASFWQQDQLTESFNGTGGIAVQPSIVIGATFNAAGSVTENQLIPQIAFIPVALDTGTVQYTESITLTTTMPDGSMQTATESSQNIGMFGVILIVVL